MQSCIDRPPKGAYTDRAWSRERGKLDEYEDRRTGDTIRAIFDALDRLGVPYWVQNAVCCWAEDWRRTMIWRHVCPL